MLALAFDTAGSGLFIALINDEKVLSKKSHQPPTG